MWYSRLKYQKIGVLVKISCKKLKVFSVPKMKKFGLISLVTSLDKLSFFKAFFFDLDNF